MMVIRASIPGSTGRVQGRGYIPLGCCVQMVAVSGAGEMGMLRAAVTLGRSICERQLGYYRGAAEDPPRLCQAGNRGRRETRVRCDPRRASRKHRCTAPSECFSVLSRSNTEYLVGRLYRRQRVEWRTFEATMRDPKKTLSNAHSSRAICR
jgi:hypothetical protein